MVAERSRAEVVTTFTDWTLSTMAVQGSSPSWQLPNAFSNGGLHGYDINGVLEGNSVFVATQLEGTTSDPLDNPGLANTDIGFTFSAFSNGENGQPCSTDDFLSPCGNIDIPNSLPADPAIQAANDNDPSKSRLQVGNVIRFSAWMRLDPAFPLDQLSTGNNTPTVEPLVKIELWKEALGTLQDTSALNPYPQSGDRIFDNQLEGLNLGSFPSEYKPEWIDLGYDGEIEFDSDAGPDGRATALSQDEWTLIEVDYELDPAHWLGIGFGGPTASDNIWTTMVDAIEEVRVTFYFGDWSAADGFSRDLSGGNILIDNLMVEVFADAATAAATPNPNPVPTAVVGLAGDFNDDGVVDVADYTVWRDNLGSETPLMNDDGLGGTVRIDHYNLWRQHFGETAPPPVSASPEPTAAVIAILPIGACLARRRRAR